MRVYTEARRQYLKRYHQDWYEKNKEAHKRRVGINREKAKIKIRNKIVYFLKSHPCVDCGESNIVVLDFDHIKENKENGIAVMVARGVSWERIKREIKKCEIRCANCHRKRHSKLLNSYKFASIA